MSQERRCQKCDAPILGNAKFCLNCGKKIVSATSKDKKTRNILIAAIIAAMVILAVCVGIGITRKTANVMENKIKEDSPMIGDVQIGDAITLGHYEQDNDLTNGAEEIEWVVLDKQDGRALVISKYALDCIPYHKKDEAVTWADCDLRAWLNNDFLGSAFTAEEQSKIPEVTVVGAGNPAYSVYGVYAGNDTKDHIFLLSIEEATKYIDDKCLPTQYTIDKGAFYNVDNTCYWWLRSPGAAQNMASFMCAGSLFDYGREVSDVYATVRPAMWIELE